MALGKLMTVFEIHDNTLYNMCVPDGYFVVPMGHVTFGRMREAYPDRRWHE